MFPSIIQQTLTWTTGSLTWVSDHSYACVYTWGVGHTDTESAQHFWLKKTHSFSYALDGIRTRVMECKVRHSTHWATPKKSKALRQAKSSDPEVQRYSTHYEADFFCSVSDPSDRVAQLVERQIRDPKIRGLYPACIRSTRKMWVFQVKNVVPTRCWCAQPPCVHTCIRIIAYAR